MKNEIGLIDVSALEALVFEKEDIRIVVRAPIRTQVKDYAFERCAADNTTVEDWLNSRIRPLIGDYEVVVVPGNTFNVHPRSTLSLVRNSYTVENIPTKKMPNHLVRAAQLQRDRELGAELRARRKALSLSVDAMAGWLGCTPAQLSRVEQGLPLIGATSIRVAMRIELHLRERAQREQERVNNTEDPEYSEEELAAANTDVADSNLDEDVNHPFWKHPDFS